LGARADAVLSPHFMDMVIAPHTLALVTVDEDDRRKSAERRKHEVTFDKEIMRTPRGSRLNRRKQESMLVQLSNLVSASVTSTIMQRRKGRSEPIPYALETMDDEPVSTTTETKKQKVTVSGMAAKQTLCPFSWLNQRRWENVLRLSVYFPSFTTLPLCLRHAEEDWATWVQGTTPEHSPPPDWRWPAERLLLVRAMREDRLLYAIAEFCSAVLGKDVTSLIHGSPAAEQEWWARAAGVMPSVGGVRQPCSFQPAVPRDAHHRRRRRRTHRAALCPRQQRVGGAR